MPTAAVGALNTSDPIPMHSADIPSMRPVDVSLHGITFPLGPMRCVAFFAFQRAIGFPPCRIFAPANSRSSSLHAGV